LILKSRNRRNTLRYCALRAAQGRRRRGFAGSLGRVRSLDVPGVEGRIFMSNRVVEALKTALSDADFAEFGLRRCRIVG